jgi:hypothetical protein
MPNTTGASRAAAGALAGGSSVLNRESWVWEKCSARAPNTAREARALPRNDFKKENGLIEFSASR